MNDLTKVDVATSLVLGATRVGEAACARRTAPSVPMFRGTGLPVGGPSARTLDRTRPFFARIDAHVGVLGLDGVMGADKVQGTVVRIPNDAAQGIPPRRTPSRC